MADVDLGVIVPLFTEPNNSDWYQVASVASRYPRVKIMAMIEPPHGNFVGAYDSGIALLTNSGVQVFGYVRPGADASENERIIKEYKTFYPRISGIVIQTGHPTRTEESGIADLAAKGFEDVLFCIETDESFTGIYKHPSGDKIGLIIKTSTPEQLREWKKTLTTLYVTNNIRWYYFQEANEQQGLSWMFEGTVRQLDMIAEQAEGKQLSYEFMQKTGYDLTPNSGGDRTGGEDHPADAIGTGKPDTAPGTVPNFDEYGIEKIYGDAQDTQKQFFLRMHPMHEARIKGPITDEFSPKTDLQNFEFTAYVKYLGRKRGGKNKLKELNAHTPIYSLRIYTEENSYYDVNILYGGFTNIGKVIDRIEAIKRAGQGTNHDLTKKWLGFKVIYYKYSPDARSPDNTKFVKIRIYLDENCTDQKGNLIITNNISRWRQGQNTEDNGRWIFPKETKKVPKDAYRIMDGRIQAVSFVPNASIDCEVRYMSIRSIQETRID